MRISDQRKQEIVATFQQTFKHNAEAEEKVRTFSISELRQTDEMLGNRDIESGFRIAIRNRIIELDDDKNIVEQRKHESKIRIWNLITGIIIGLVVSGVAKVLF
jgi:hypothetical protein